MSIVDTDKANMDIRCPVSGLVSQVLVETDEMVYEEHPIIVIDGASIKSSRVRLKYKGVERSEEDQKRHDSIQGFNKG